MFFVIFFEQTIPLLGLLIKRHRYWAATVGCIGNSRTQYGTSRIRSICEIPCFSGTNMCFKLFSPKFRSIPLAIPLLIFSLLGLLAFFVKKFGDLVFTWKNNSTPGIVKSRACASLF